VYSNPCTADVKTPTKAPEFPRQGTIWRGPPRPYSHVAALRTHVAALRTHVAAFHTSVAALRSQFCSLQDMLLSRRCGTSARFRRDAAHYSPLPSLQKCRIDYRGNARPRVSAPGSNWWKPRTPAGS